MIRFPRSLQAASLCQKVLSVHASTQKVGQEALKAQDFHLRAHHLHEIHLLNEVDHPIQAGIDVTSVIADRANSNLCALPKVVVPHLRNGDIKPVLDALDHLLKDVALSLQRMVFWDPKIQLANADHHLHARFALRPVQPSSELPERLPTLSRQTWLNLFNLIGFDDVS